MKKPLAIHHRNFSEQLFIFALFSFAFAVVSYVIQVSSHRDPGVVLLTLFITLVATLTFVLKITIVSGSYLKAITGACFAWLGFFCGSFMPDCLAWGNLEGWRFYLKAFFGGWFIYLFLFVLILSIYHYKSWVKKKRMNN